MTRTVSLTVNGRSLETTVEPRTHLADFVRDRLHLTGTHLGCEHGVCGACTVLIDGAPMRSCIAYAIACDGAEVRTIEGFDDDPLMQALRDAFTRHHALQCGYCTPGMLITAYDIVRRLPDAGETRVREELSGNLCRCTGYVGIVQAVRSVLADPPAVDAAPLGVMADSSAPPRGGVASIAAPEPRSSAPPQGSGSGGAEQDSTRHSFNRRTLDKTTLRNRSAEQDSTSHPSGPLPRFDASARMPQGPARQETQEASMVDSPSAPPGADASATAPARHASATPEAAGSEHEITLAIPPDTLWSALQDVATVVRCLPGASLTGPATADPLSLRMTVAIGPIRARFDGTARVAFDDRGRTATIEGKGHDARSRSTSEGRIGLSVRPSRIGGSVLTLRLHYALKGPLAQFSRGAVVDMIVKQLLDRFAANLAGAVSGAEVEAAEPPGEADLGIAAVWRRLRRWLSGEG